MDVKIPIGSRPASRVLLFGPSGRVLLLHAGDTGSPATRRDLWICPGGGVEEGETWEQAAHREVWEETGLSIHLHRPIWFRRHVFTRGGRGYDLLEVFLVGRSASEQVAPCQPDSYVRGCRWWSVDEVLAADAVFAPRRFKELVPPLARGEFPAQPFDCGV